jgi:hypothetical protein
MRSLSIAAALVAALATPAIAGCPYGQILRVSMGKCVNWHSKLAAGYVHLPRHKRIAVVALLKPPKSSLISDGVYYLPIESAELLRERLARPRMALDRDAILLSRAAALVEER